MSKKDTRKIARIKANIAAKTANGGEALEVYELNQQLVAAQVAQLVEAALNHDRKRTEAVNWAHVGSLAHVAQQLDNLIAFLG